MLNKSCSVFIDELGSSAPVPGGGSAAALAGAVGIALGTMVGELTTGKKKYAEYENEITELLYKSKALTEEFKAAVQKDIDAFKPLAASYAMPSSTDEEKAARKASIQENLVTAAMAPMELAEICVKALKIIDSYSLIGSRLCVSDAGCGAAMCEAALKCARLNVLANLTSMEDQEKKAELMRKIDCLSENGIHIAGLTYKRVDEMLK